MLGRDGGRSAPSPVDAGQETGDESSPDAGVDLSAEEEGGHVDASVDVPGWLDESRVQRYDGPDLEQVTISLWDVRGPDGQCFIPPGWSFYIGIDPDAGTLICFYPPGTWEHIICDCVADTLFPDAGYDRDR